MTFCYSPSMVVTIGVLDAFAELYRWVDVITFSRSLRHSSVGVRLYLAMPYDTLLQGRFLREVNG